MSVRAGTNLGSYEVISALGVGGMGEVYRATDSNLIARSHSTSGTTCLRTIVSDAV
jgi:hypothetical protein